MSGLSLGVANIIDSLGTLIGNRISAAGEGAQLGLEVPVNFASPNGTVTQAFSAFAFYSGTPGASQGTFQGGSSEAAVNLNSAVTQAALGFEGIVSPSGTGSLSQAIGLQGSAFAANTVGVTDLISIAASGPFASSGTPVVTNAYSVRIAEPTVGTNRYSLLGVGRHRMYKGTPGNVLELANAGNTLQWACDGSDLIGFASDGASERIQLSPQDGASERLAITYAGGSTKGLYINDVLGTGTGNVIEYAEAGTPKFAVLANGNLYLTETTTTSSPSAGGAGALPATPAGYVTLSINGTARQIPYY